MSRDSVSWCPGRDTTLGPALTHRTVAISRDEHRDLCKLYGFVQEKPRERPPEPAPLGPKATSDERRDHENRVRAWKAWSDPRRFHQAGADANMMRYAEEDGLRIVAWLAKFVEPGSDPLKALVSLAADAGWDVDPVDVAWSQDECDDEDEDDGDLVVEESA